MAWMTLFKTKDLQHLLKHISFTVYNNLERKKHFDTGSLLYHVAKAANLDIAEIDMIGEGYFTHYWNITSHLFVSKSPPDNRVREKYELIKTRLAELRSLTQVNNRDKSRLFM